MKTQLILAASFLVAIPASYAQVAPAPAPPAPAGAPAPIVRAQRMERVERMRDDGMRGMHDGGDMHEMHGPMGGGLPPGTWWRNQEIATRIGLTAEQQKKIDDIFLQSRVQLIHLHASLEEAQLMLEPLLNASPVDQPKALAQIGKIADTRAELEKTDAKMLLTIRAVLTADQWTKLQDHHRMHGPGEMGAPCAAGQRGPMGHRGPGGGPGGPPAPPQ